MAPAVRVYGGRYRTLRCIGAGGFAVVLEAEDLRNGGRVALKVLRPELSAQPQVLARFLREARTLAMMKGEHVARILDVSGGTNTEPPFIVMEYLAGEDLGAILAREGVLSPSAAVRHILQTCRAIAEAHTLGIVHRDLKPSNLFLTTKPDGSACIKVLDFGIAKWVNAPENALLTRSRELLGTPTYMAPEQLRSDAVGPRADVWALGATLYELLAGEPAFAAPRLPELFAKVLHEAPPPLRSNVPPELASVIARCLQKNPADRFPDLASFAEAIKPFALSTTSFVRPSELETVIVPAVAPPRRALRNTFIALGIAASFAMSVGASKPLRVDVANRLGVVVDLEMTARK